MRTFHMAGLLSTTASSTPAPTAAPSRGIRRARALTPAAASTATDSATSGRARGVDRRARPAALRVNALNRAPAGDGPSQGWAPTPIRAPTASSSRK